MESFIEHQKSGPIKRPVESSLMDNGSDWDEEFDRQGLGNAAIKTHE
jgi:hypothetical protein